MANDLTKLTMDELLELWDWNRRLATSDYSCGYADAIGQAIISVGRLYGGGVDPYQFEAYKRVMEDTTMEAYWAKYPTPLSKNFPADVIRQNGGKL